MQLGTDQMVNHFSVSCINSLWQIVGFQEVWRNIQMFSTNSVNWKMFQIIIYLIVVAKITESIKIVQKSTGSETVSCYFIENMKNWFGWNTWSSENEFHYSFYFIFLKTYTIHFDIRKFVSNWIEIKIKIWSIRFDIVISLTSSIYFARIDTPVWDECMWLVPVPQIDFIVVCILNRKWIMILWIPRSFIYIFFWFVINENVNQAENCIC